MFIAMLLYILLYVLVSLILLTIAITPIVFGAMGIISGISVGSTIVVIGGIILVMVGVSFVFLIIKHIIEDIENWKKFK